MVERRPVVAIFRDLLLPRSETFICSQAEALRRNQPWYVGSKIVDSSLLPMDRVIVLHSGGIVGVAQELLFKQFNFAPYLVRRLRRIQPTLIHAHFGPDGALALPIKHALNTPLVVTFHGYDATVTDEYAKRSFYTHRLFLRRREALKEEADLFVAVSKYIHAKLMEQGFPPERSIVHHIGIDTDFFSPDDKLPREPVVLFVGRLVEKKGCEHLIRAMRIVQATSPDAQLMVIGDGPLRIGLEEQAGTSLNNASFVGFQPPETVKKWMNRAKVLCVPSVVAKNGDAEGLGIVFLEAQAMRLPVVSFDTGGIPEAVMDSETGFLLPEGDHGGLAEHILILLRNRELWEQFGSQGQRYMRESFDIKGQTSELEEIYQALRSGRGT